MYKLIISFIIMLNAQFLADLPQQSFQPIKVLMFVFNPIIESENNKKLTELFHWNDPDSLAQIYIADLHEVSGGQLKYHIVNRLEVDDYPVKKDGFQYTDDSFLTCWNNRELCHQPDNVDYEAIIQQFNLIPQIETGVIDEVWLFGFPYGGFWESTMAGNGAFFCNSDPVPNTEDCPRRFIIMGFNYERGVGCMLEDFGHRTESIMRHVYRHKKGDSNLWQQFIQYDKIAADSSGCGNVHFAPNSEKDYDWGNERFVTSNCDDWYNFPNFKGLSRKVNCAEWGNGDMRAHHKWWFNHIPRVEGNTDGVLNNWWFYLVDCNNVD